MTQQTEFYVQAIWDDEEKTYYSESNIRGLNLVTETLEEFWDLVDHFTPELIFCNHFQEKTQKTPAKVQKSSPPKHKKVFSFTPLPAEGGLPKMA